MDAVTSRTETRSRIVDTAAELLREHGSAAVTTRRVADGAGVQAPTIYRLFGDKDGLLEAVAEHVMATYVSAKAAVVEAATEADVDPIDDLRDGWQTQIDFGVANPMLFGLLIDPNRETPSAAARSGGEILAARVHRIAQAGRLRVSEKRAVDLVHAAGTGAILTILSTAPDRREPGLAADMLDAVLRQILTDAPEQTVNGSLSATVAFKAVASELTMLSDAERHLLREWLDRVIDAP